MKKNNIDIISNSLDIEENVKVSEDEDESGDDGIEFSPPPGGFKKRQGMTAEEINEFFSKPKKIKRK